MTKYSNVLLWIGQIFLALFFVFGSGGPKLVLPADVLPLPIPLPQAFVWFIGICEVLGGLGLVLPGVTRTRPRLTVLAAVCLTALTICAAVYQLIAGQPGNAIFALVMGVISAAVAYGRVRNPLPSRRQSPTVPQLA